MQLTSEEMWCFHHFRWTQKRELLQYGPEQKMFCSFARLRNSQGLEGNVQIFPSVGVFRIWGCAVLFVSINVCLTRDPARV